MPTQSEIKLHTLDKVMDESNDEGSNEDACDSQPFEPCDGEEDVQVYPDQVLNGYTLIEIAVLNLVMVLCS